MKSRILIYSNITSTRFEFTCDLLFEQLLGIGYQIVQDPLSAHLVYSTSSPGSPCISIPQCCDLLRSKGYEPITVPFKNSGEGTILFPAEKETEGKWNFDLFSAVFYLVSRYEEYKGFEPDAHKRFPPEASILHRTDSFEFPLVNIWVQKLKNEILEKWPETNFNEPKFRFISTIDVDSTFQFKEKGFKWSLAGFLKDILKGNFHEVKKRFTTLTGRSNDAFDLFDEITGWHQTCKTEAKYFFLLGDYGPYDKNIDWQNKKQAAIIKKLAAQNTVGLHPSYLSNSLEGQLEKEISRLQAITGQKPVANRQHFLVHSFPGTYQKLIENGINEDHTMGFTSRFGFRASIASPFYFYHLEKEEATNLLLYPFCSMDITPLHYYKLSPEQAIEKNRELLRKVKDVNGVFISLWHNESLSGELRWKAGWRKVYLQLLKDAFVINNN